MPVFTGMTEKAHDFLNELPDRTSDAKQSRLFQRRFRHPGAASIKGY
jgi:hypothetical protein